MKEKIKTISITANVSILEALKRMDELNVRLLLIMQNNTFICLLSIGDIQRAIIKNLSLSTPIDEILRKNIQVAKVGDNYDEIKKEMLSSKTECMPILGDKNELIDVIFWEDLFSGKELNDDKLNLPVIIMAGGLGTRMQPLTNIIPKPLLPIDDKTIAEHIINNFNEVGCTSFFFSINYKSEMIKDYFSKLKGDYTIEYFEEKKPLGTAGSLHLLDGKICTTFFISNCDILIEGDYREFYRYHKEYKNELTIIASFRHYDIPYGTLETVEEGRLISFEEKPQLSKLINSGMYIVEPHLLKEIPENSFFHITDLIRKIMERDGRVGVFPVSEKSWTDIGEWDKYLETIKFKRKI